MHELDATSSRTLFPIKHPVLAVLPLPALRTSPQVEPSNPKGWFRQGMSRLATGSRPFVSGRGGMGIMGFVTGVVPFDEWVSVHFT